LRRERVKGFFILTTTINRKENIMADYFTKFSAVLPLPNEAARRYALDATANASRARQGDEPSEKLPASIQEVNEDWRFETDAESGHGKRGLWLHSDYGGIDAVCAFIQHLLQKCGPEGQVALEWSNDCSNARTSTFVTSRETTQKGKRIVRNPRLAAKSSFQLSLFNCETLV
jgi:hypothetical protein